MNTSGAVLASRFSPDASAAPRRIAHHVHGRQHGPIQRLVRPSDIGELIKPFVFLDYANVPPRDSMFGIHPHSGIATLTVVISGALSYEDTTGKSGSVGAGGLEWMKAGGSTAVKRKSAASAPGYSLRADYANPSVSSCTSLKPRLEFLPGVARGFS